MEAAMKNADRHRAGESGAIPAAENGGHARSPAAHLHEDAKLHDNQSAVKHPVQTGQLREPPQEVSRSGKAHRG
jgi:hypothetical protein